MAETKEESTWFISTEHIQSLIKNAVAAIPEASKQVYEQTLVAIGSTTTYIKKSTETNTVLVLDDCSALAAKLTKTASELQVQANDGYDSLRVKLGTSLTDLGAAITSHKEWAEEYAKVKATEIKETSTAGLTALKEHYETTLASIAVALTAAEDKVKENLTTATENAQKLKEDWSKTVVEKTGEAQEKATVFATETKEKATVFAAETQEKVGVLISDTKEKVAVAYAAGVESASTTADELKVAAEGVKVSVTEAYTAAVEATSPYVAHVMEVAQSGVDDAKSYFDAILNGNDTPVGSVKNVPLPDEIAVGDITLEEKK